MDTPATNAAKIVEELLDNDAAKEYALGLNIDSSGATPEQLKVFKRQAAGYIKWVNDNSDEAVQDASLVLSADTFNEVVVILSRHEIPDASFISMISQGYF